MTWMLRSRSPVHEIRASRRDEGVMSYGYMRGVYRSWSYRASRKGKIRALHEGWDVAGL